MGRKKATTDPAAWLKGRDICGVTEGELRCTRSPGHERRGSTGSAMHYDLLKKRSFRLRKPPVTPT